MNNQTSLQRPDNLDYFHGLSPEQLRLAERLERAANQRKKEILASMGVRFKREAEWAEIAREARKNHNIIVYQVDDDKHPEGGYWDFQRNGKTEVLLGYPNINKEKRLVFRVRYEL